MTKTGFIGVVPAVGKRRLVAQVSNLLYRRFPIGRVLHGWGERKRPNAPQVGNLRYSRLEVCATRFRRRFNTDTLAECRFTPGELKKSLLWTF